MNAMVNATPLAVWWPALQTDLQVYLLQGETIGLVDTAAPGASLTETLASNGHGLADISLVLNTHAHSDHAGGNALVKAASGAQICIHKDDAALLEDPGLCHDRFFGLLAKTLRGDEAAAAERAGYIEQMGGGLPADRLLEDGEVVDLGGSLELSVVHLPGHTPGSVGFYWEKEGVLITGDSVAGLGTPEGNLPLVFDMAAYQRSIDRLLGLPINLLYTTHPYRGLRVPSATVRQGPEVRMFLEDAKELASRLAEALRAQTGSVGEKTPLEIADAVVDMLPPEMGHKKLAELPFPDFTLNTVLAGTPGLWK